MDQERLRLSHMQKCTYYVQICDKHKYMTAHFPGLVQALQSGWVKAPFLMK